MNCFRHDAGPKVRLHRADDAMMRAGQASLQPPRSWWLGQLSNDGTEDRSGVPSLVVVVLGVESPWRVGLTDGIESPTVILRVS